MLLLILVKIIVWFLIGILVFVNILYVFFDFLVILIDVLKCVFNYIGWYFLIMLYKFFVICCGNIIGVFVLI